MKHLLEWATYLGLENVGMRETYLKRLFHAHAIEVGLFFITSYDFVFRPHDRKFNGIIHLFLDANAPYAVNMYDAGRAKVKSMILPCSPLVREDLNNLPTEPTRGRRVGGEIGTPHKPVGLRELGSANYSIQALALETIVSGGDCMDYQQSVTNSLPIWKQSIVNPPPESAFQATLWQTEKGKIAKEMSDYWYTQDRRDMGLYLL